MKLLHDWYIGKRITIRYHLQSLQIGIYIGVYFWIEIPFIGICIDLRKDITLPF